MALLYGLLWRFLLILVHVNRALVSWLRVRLRTWKGRMWERAMAALLLPLALAGFPDHHKKVHHNPADANPVTGNRTATRRSRWLSDGRSLEKLPVHIGLLVAEEEPSYTDIANLVVWCMAVGISYVSVYDNHGKHSALQSLQSIIEFNVMILLFLLLVTLNVALSIRLAETNVGSCLHPNLKLRLNC